MASPYGSRSTFSIASDEKGSSIDIQISEQPGITADNLSLSTWGSSFVLANILHKLNIPSRLGKQQECTSARRPLSVLELGAGTGLVGISVAALWQAEVLLTDLPPILPALDANISLNTVVLSQTTSSISSASLDWNNPKELLIKSTTSKDSAQNPCPQTWKADLILAADTLYTEDHPQLILNTILTWLSVSPNSRALLCYPLRIAYIDHIRAFWELAEAAGLECVEEGREDAGGEDWNEVASTPYEWCLWGWRR